MYTCGVDIGSRSIEIVLFDGEKMVAYTAVDTGASPKENALSAFEETLRKGSISRADVVRVLATGYGRNYFEEADKVSSEILCHAAGVYHEFPDVKTVIDIGGQDSKMIQVGAGGRVQNFVMNDRCAAGTGKFIEMVARTVALSIEEIGTLALSTDQTCDISSMCAVFAESEIIGLLHRGMPIEVILRGVFKSVAKRTLGMSGKTGLEDKIVFTGGVAKNPGVVDSIRIETRREIYISQNPQLTGALGAAIIAQR